MISTKDSLSLKTIIAFIALISSSSSTSFAESRVSNIEEYVNKKKLKLMRNDVIAENDIILGNRDAPVLVIEYFSPTCSHCADYHVRIFPTIKSEYIDTGKIAYVLRECASNRQDLDASILARCKKDSSSYLKIINALLSDQDQWIYTQDYRNHLTIVGNQNGVLDLEYKACLSDDNSADAILNHTKFITQDTHIIGTPSFYINGQLLRGHYSLEDIVSVIDQAVDAINFRQF